MRILYIVPYAPDLIRVRPYQLIRALAGLGHEVDLVTLWSSRQEEEGLRQMALENGNIRIHARRLARWRPVWNCLRALPSRMPLQAFFSFQPDLVSEVGNLLRECSFDIVHVEHLRGSVYGLKVRRLLSRRDNDLGRRQRRIPVVWDSVDCISHLFGQARRESRSLMGRWMTRLELPRTRSFEGWLVSQFDHILTSSAIDRDALAALGGLPCRSRSISVLPNGVDLEYFRPPTEARDQATVVFAGKMSYHANLTAAVHLIEEIMPRVWRRRPEVKIVVAGKNPPRVLRALASSANGLAGNPHNASVVGAEKVKVTGTVPDIRPYLQRAAVSVAPLLYGAGIQNKVLEAMACATPVIASPQAVAALSVEAGRDVVVAPDPAAFAGEMLALLEDRVRRETIGAAGRAYVEARHDWREIAKLLESSYRCAIEAVRGEDSRQSPDAETHDI